ncbi:hypothetical protein BC834DRAFT_434560 [Gloeopeniophorella convolvens]|nr:hypothetical protein BC834DRAFT_434560 [Gloeopeniophorella convolvens]
MRPDNSCPCPRVPFSPFYPAIFLSGPLRRIVPETSNKLNLHQRPFAHRSQDTLLPSRNIISLVRTTPSMNWTRSSCAPYFVPRVCIAPLHVTPARLFRYGIYQLCLSSKIISRWTVPSLSRTDVFLAERLAVNLDALNAYLPCLCSWVLDRVSYLDITHAQDLPRPSDYARALGCRVALPLYLSPFRRNASGKLGAVTFTTEEIF